MINFNFKVGHRIRRRLPPLGDEFASNYDELLINILVVM
jgi:hypothetical protein